MAQQTAVDWYYEQTVVQGKTNYYELLEQAKQMEREQIVKAHDDGDFWSGKKYYTKTYGK